MPPREPKADVQQNQNFATMLKNLYLSAESSDIQFICEGADGVSENVPAHKLLLSAASDGFKTLFSVTRTEFKADGMPAAALKEFMQFFYMPKVHLTLANIENVLKLSKMYGNQEVFACCNRFLEQNLTIENSVWFYGLSIQFDLSLKSVCETKIADEAFEVLKTAGFRECDSDVLRHILLIETLKCDEFQVLTACLAWAKSSAERKELNGADVQVLRGELGDLLYQIRIKSLTMKEFAMVIESFSGLFTASELEAILQMIVDKDFQSEKFNNNPRTMMPNDVFVCDRFYSKAKSQYPVKDVDRTRFDSNRAVWFVGFTCDQVNNKDAGTEGTQIQAKWSVIYRGGDSTDAMTLLGGDITLTSNGSVEVPIQPPVLIQANQQYEILLEQDTTPAHFTQTNLKQWVKLRSGITVKFFGEAFDDAKTGLVTQLQFKRK